MVLTQCYLEWVFSCRILYSGVGCLYVSCSGSVTSVGEGRVNLSAIVFVY